MDGSTLKFGFVCVQNAGRSQMSAAFAERERTRRGLEDEVEILTGGTHPAEEVHPEVVEAMQELDIDISGRTALLKPSTSDRSLRACCIQRAYRLRSLLSNPVRENTSQRRYEA